MPIAPSDIKFALSGGVDNTDPNASLGGACATVAGGGTYDITSNVKNNLFDDVTGAESAVGAVEYRGFYVVNTHATLALQNAVIWLSALTSSEDTEFDLGIAVEGVNATMATIPDETTAPTGVTFSRPITLAAGLSLNTSSPATGLAHGDFRGVWVRRTVSASAAAANDAGTVSVGGDTAA